ncbi:MAG: hypothetical protein RIS36_1048 [Pseudomonadota bacterium]|jgi:hypothetical protein
MTQTPEIISTNTFDRHYARDMILLADVCFEMFPLKELRKPHLILGELRSAFPEFEDAEILHAISMALSWRRLLRDAGRPLH